LEIRRFYRKWGELSFDDDFVTLANGYDLLMIGGGNYFELWVEHSRTGTTVDLPPELLETLTTPTVFYGLGLDPEKGYSESTCARFRTFLDYVLEHDRFLVSVRNDGSLGHATRLFGAKYADRIHSIPDGGFFTVVEDQNHPELAGAGKTLAVNLAGDMLDRRFDAKLKNGISADEFLKGYVAIIEGLLADYPDLCLVLIPHISQDYTMISALLDGMDDRLCRTRVKVAPLLRGESGQACIFDLYRKSDLVMGNRFHTNVCAIGLGIPSIGLVNYPKISALYDEIGMPDRAVIITRQGFEERINALAREALENPYPIKARYHSICKELEQTLDAFHGHMRSWLAGIRGRGSDL